MTQTITWTISKILESCEGPEGDEALRLGRGKNGWTYGPIFPVFYVQDFVRFRVAAQKEAKSLLLQGHTAGDP